MKRKYGLCSLMLILTILTVNIRAVTAYAAPLNEKDSTKAIDAISESEFGGKEVKDDYLQAISDSNAVYISSFTITDLEEPVNGELLDKRATVLTSAGFSWEIPVIWVNKYGDPVDLGIVLDGVVICYPVICFYLPKGYYILHNDSATYDIDMPSFFCDLVDINGLTTVSNTEDKVTYLFAMPMDDFRVRDIVIEPESSGTEQVTPEPTQSSPAISPSGGGGEEPKPAPYPEDDPTPEPAPSPEPQPQPEPDIEEKTRIVTTHCDSSVVTRYGVENLYNLIALVKNVIHPEAMTYLVDHFPTFTSAYREEGLSEQEGLHIIYTATSDALSYVTSGNDISAATGTQDLEFHHRLTLNSCYLFSSDTDPESGETAYTLDTEAVRKALDNRMIYAEMQSVLNDSLRAGMSGSHYDAQDDSVTKSNYSSVKYPDWFGAALGASVMNPYQMFNEAFHENFNYDEETGTYSASGIVSDNTVKLISSSNNMYPDVEAMKPAYTSNYLACVYLGHLAALKYNGQSAISTDSGGNVTNVDSAIIRGGVDKLLEKLNSGMTLDEVISEISTDDSQATLYSDTQDFSDKFLLDNNAPSTEFCTAFLNYLESKCSDTGTVNGSILQDFSSTVTSPLDESLLADPVTAFAISDSKEWVASSVNEEDAYTGGGKSAPGTINDNSAANNLSTMMLAAPAVLAPENESECEEDPETESVLESEGVAETAEAEASEINEDEYNNSTIEEYADENTIIPSIMINNDNQDGQESDSEDNSESVEFDALPAETSSDDDLSSDDSAEPDETGT
ncbi:hypothetical protein [Butyrivibrio sp. NC2007]|uniref:hypothetical protein n=1 Tax=Butyrivibrio sp. NC2007 TaxID=1280683 RepID=UPI0003B412D2|nr:hypothetical protein [Butyrivibrio sp. NC2007]